MEIETLEEEYSFLAAFTAYIALAMGLHSRNCSSFQLQTSSISHRIKLTVLLNKGWGVAHTP